jgi:large subunit ribosomal protein L9
MAKRIELLLVETVENLGIVGDVVKVRPGFARNYLLPLGLAESPSHRRLEELQEKRKQVQADLARQRAEREALHERMVTLELSVVRSCNDQGALYGSVTQRDIADALVEAGYNVNVRAVRLGQAIKRVGSYHVPIHLDRDLKADLTLNIQPDHPIGEEREEMEFDNEGRLIQKPRERKDKRGKGEITEEQSSEPSPEEPGAKKPRREKTAPVH